MTLLQIRELSDPESRDEWNQFVAAAPQGDILQSWEWGELKARSGWRPTRLFVFDQEKTVGAISILSRRLPDLVRETLRLPAPMPNVSICYAPHGPVAPFDRADVVRATLDAGVEAARRLGGFVLKVEPTVEAPEAATILEGAGFHRSSADEGFGGTQPRAVMQLSLEPDLDTLLANCKQKTRYNIRLGQKKRVMVRAGETVEDLRAFYDLLKVTAVRDRFQVRGFEYFRDMWEILGGAGMLKLFLTEHEGDFLSGALLFLFGRWCVYAYGASSNEKRQLMPNYLMQWEMVRWAKEQGFAVYDFRGVSPSRAPSADDHLAGLNRFKEGFGAHYLEYIGDYDRVLNSAWNFAWNQGMPLLRTAMKHMRSRTAA